MALTMRARAARKWLAAFIVFVAIALALRGFLARIVGPLAATLGVHVNPTAILAIEIFALALYTLGLFAFPEQFWRRAFKFFCLMAAYMLLGPLLAAAIASAGADGSMVSSAALAAASVAAGHLAALLVGYSLYRLAWPGLAPHAPRFNPARGSVSAMR